MPFLSRLSLLVTIRLLFPSAFLLSDSPDLSLALSLFL